MSDREKKPLGRPRSTQAHQAMLQATLELLTEVGFDAISMEAIAARAGIGKATIYRRYSSKEELVADAIESVRQEVVIPDTGNLWSDLQALIENAALVTLSPLGRKAVAMLIGSAASNAKFAQLYWKNYLQPRRQAFAIVLERAKARQELRTEIDPGLVFDTMSGIMLYSLLFPPTSETWESYVYRALELLLTGREADNSDRP